MVPLRSFEPSLGHSRSFTQKVFRRRHGKLESFIFSYKLWALIVDIQRPNGVTNSVVRQKPVRPVTLAFIGTTGRN